MGMVWNRSLNPLEIDHGSTSPGSKLLSSRARLAQAILDALDSAHGLILVTGEAGVGKTWVVQQVIPTLEPSWEPVWIDVTPVTTSRGLLETVGRFLSVPGGTGSGDLVSELRTTLQAASQDGRRFVLVLDEAQNADAMVLETIRGLSNRLGDDDGLAALIVLGQTSLVTKLAQRPWSAWRSRIQFHHHLRNLDAIEAAELVRQVRPELDWEVARVEDLHRRVLGNPRALIQTVALPHPSALRTERPAALAPSSSPSRTETPVREAIETVGLESTSGVEDRPPLRYEEGLIEVGWPVEEPRTEGRGSTPIALEIQSRDQKTSPMLAWAGLVEIEDPYAAIQARDERIRLEQRLGPRRSVEADDLVEQETASGRSVRVRAESSHQAAPYSPIFSRFETDSFAEDDSL